MEHLLSDRIKAIAPSATLAMSQLSDQLKSQGIDVINLSVGELDQPTPPQIKQAGIRAIEQNYTFYAPVPGYMALRKAISNKLARENGLNYAPEQIVVGNGAKHEVCNVIMAVVNPGDEVIIPTPAWVSYPQMVNLAGGKVIPIECPMSEGFLLDPTALEEAITDRTKLLILCSPSNPTGAVYPQERLRQIAQVVARHPNLLVLSDEIYEHFIYEGEHHSIATFPEIADRCVVVNGLSKGFAMTGWRVGYIAAPLWLSKAVTKLQGQYTGGSSSIAQMAALQAYDGANEGIEQLQQLFRSRRDAILQELSHVPGVKTLTPAGAFYVFPDMSAYIGSKTPDGELILTADELALYLLRQAHVATVSGVAFGANTHLRISYAADVPVLKQAVERIRKALMSLSR